MMTIMVITIAITTIMKIIMIQKVITVTSHNCNNKTFSNNNSDKN